MVGALDRWLRAPGLVVVYDGECPFCSAYVRMLRLRDAAGPVTLVNGRERPDVVAEMKERGLDLNRNMLAIYGSKLHAGSDAMTLLSMLSTRSGHVNRAAAWLFASPTRSRLLYPVLRGGRAIALRVLGRKAIT